jgi:hypothetical protein
MLKETITYDDFDGVSTTEEMYFNLTKLELTEMAMDLPDGIAEDINKLKAKDITLVVDYAQADDKKGTKRMNAMVVFPKDLKVGAVGKYQLTVIS